MSAPSAIAASSASRSVPRSVVDDHLGRIPREEVSIDGFVTAQQAGHLRGRRCGIRDLCRHGDERRRPARVDDLGTPRQDGPRQLGGGGCIEGHEGVAGHARDDVVAGADRPQPLHGLAGRAPGVGERRGSGAILRGARGRAEVVGRHGRVEHEDLARAGADVRLVRVRVDRDRLGSREREVGQPLAGPQVVHVQRVAGGHVEPVAAARDGRRVLDGGEGVVPARLERRVADRRPEVARGHHLVVPEEVDPLRDGVLGQVRVGVLVDPVRLAVVPVLQELGRRPGVVDLVEVHPQRLAEPEGPQAERRDHEDQQEPEIEPVEAAAGLAAQARGPVERRRHRVRREGDRIRVDHDRGQHATGRLAIGLRRLGHQRSREIRRQGARLSGRRRGRRPIRLRRRADHGARRPRLVVGPVGLARDRAHEERRGYDQATGVGERRQPDAQRGARRLAEAGAQPAERVEHRPQARALVERQRQDPVEVREVRRREHRVDGSPARPQGKQDRPQREERVQVALVDPGGEDEEGDRHHGQGDEEPAPVVVAPPEQDAEGRDGHQDDATADEDGRDPEQRVERVRGAHRVRDVADPRPGRGKPVAVQRHERPGVVAVHRDVRVAAGRLEDLAQQAVLEGHEARDRDDRQAEGQAHERRGHQAGDRRRGDTDRAAAEPASVVGALHPVAPDDHHGGQGDQDPELRLDDRGDRGQDRRPFRPPAPQLPDGEHEEERAHRVHLGPDGTVEPRDRHEQEDGGGGQGAATARSQLGGQGEDGQGQGQVGDDRRQLEEVADGDRERLGDEPEAPQDVQVARRVVHEDRAVVEAPRPVRGELHGPAAEAPQVDLEPGAGQQDVCDDEAKGEAERKKDGKRDDRVPHANPGLLAGPRALARCGAWHGCWYGLLERALRWTGV